VECALRPSHTRPPHESDYSAVSRMSGPLPLPQAGLHRFRLSHRSARWRKAYSLITCARQLPSKWVENGNEWERRWPRASAIPCLFPLNGSAADRGVSCHKEGTRKSRPRLMQQDRQGYRSLVVSRAWTRMAICCGARRPRTVCASQAVMRAEKVYLLPRFPRWMCCEILACDWPVRVVELPCPFEQP
jgi:hypothetical protein